METMTQDFTPFVDEHALEAAKEAHRLYKDKLVIAEALEHCISPSEHHYREVWQNSYNETESNFNESLKVASERILVSRLISHLAIKNS